MRRALAYSFSIALSLSIIPLADAQSQGMGGMGGMGGMEMKGMDMKPAAGTQAAHKTTGVVKKVDPKASTVTLAHDPVKSLNWPAMTMAFKAKDKAMLENVKPGAKMEFSFVQSGKDYVIIDMK